MHKRNNCFCKILLPASVCSLLSLMNWFWFYLNKENWRAHVKYYSMFSLSLAFFIPVMTSLSLEFLLTWSSVFSSSSCILFVCSANFFFIRTVDSLLRLYTDFFWLGFTPCKAEQPLQGMELQEKEAQKD